MRSYQFGLFEGTPGAVDNCSALVLGLLIDGECLVVLDLQEKIYFFLVNGILGN